MSGLELLCRVLSTHSQSMTTTIHDQWLYSVPVVIFFLSPQEELVGDDDTIAKRECHSAQAGEETGGHAGC